MEASGCDASRAIVNRNLLFCQSRTLADTRRYKYLHSFQLAPYGGVRFLSICSWEYGFPTWTPVLIMAFGNWRYLVNAKRRRNVFIGAGMVLASFLGMIAATTGTINLSGSEPGILEITVTAEPQASNLPLNTTVVDLKVGTVTERSNKKAGYTVTLGSANALASSSASPSFRSTETTDFLPYSLKYGGKAVAFSAGGAASVVSSVSAKTSAAGIVNIVSVSFDGASAFLDEAVYTDTLTFTIIAK